MGRKRNVWIGLISAAAALFIVFGIYVMQLKQIEWQRSVRILVPVSFIPAGTLITEEMVKWKTIAEAAYVEGMATELGSVVQMENIVPLGSEEPILLWKLDKFRLLPSSEQATFQIPREYVLSISSGIRAGDLIDLYVSGPGGRSGRLFEEKIRVASVKSASGVEVDDRSSTNLVAGLKGDKERMYASRKEDSGVIDRINLNLTEAQWLQIDRLCRGGENKLVIAFTSATWEEDPS